MQKPNKRVDFKTTHQCLKQAQTTIDPIMCRCSKNKIERSKPHDIESTSAKIKTKKKINGNNTTNIRKKKKR